MQKKVSDLNANIAQLKREISHLNEDTGSKEGDIDLAKSFLNDLEAEKRRLQSRVDSLEEDIAHDEVAVKKLLSELASNKAKNSDRYPGFFDEQSSRNVGNQPYAQHSPPAYQDISNDSEQIQQQASRDYLAEMADNLAKSAGDMLLNSFIEHAPINDDQRQNIKAIKFWGDEALINHSLQEEFGGVTSDLQESIKRLP